MSVSQPALAGGERGASHSRLWRAAREGPVIPGSYVVFLLAAQGEDQEDRRRQQVAHSIPPLVAEVSREEQILQNDVLLADEIYEKLRSQWDGLESWPLLSLSSCQVTERRRSSLDVIAYQA